jgi:hypothetical protein
MIKILCTLIFFFIFPSQSTFSQTTPKKINTNQFGRNAVLFELAGQGGFYSVNYERNIFQREITNVCVRGGLSYVLYPYIGEFLSFPLGTNLMLGRNEKLELGLGITYALFYNNYTLAYPSANIAYRTVLNEQSGSFMKFGYTPYLSPDSKFHNWFVFGFGLPF